MELKVKSSLINKMFYCLVVWYSYAYAELVYLFSVCYRYTTPPLRSSTCSRWLVPVVDGIYNTLVLGGIQVSAGVLSVSVPT